MESLDDLCDQYTLGERFLWKRYRTIGPQEGWATHSCLDGLHGIGERLREPKSMTPWRSDALEDDADEAGDELEFAPAFAF
jgi:hypothetical protein